MLILFLSLSLLFWTTKSATLCPDLWIPYHESCYLFAHQNLSFFEAEHYCELHKSHLVHIETAVENAFIKDHITYLPAKSNWWVGLTDDDVEGNWVWFSTDVSASFTDWGLGQPSDQSFEEDCCSIQIRLGQWGWHDTSCHNTNLYPICEIEGGLDEIVG